MDTWVDSIFGDEDYKKCIKPKKRKKSKKKPILLVIDEMEREIDAVDEHHRPRSSMRRIGIGN